MSEKMKVKKIQIKDFKNLCDVDLTLNGNSIYVVGKNRLGKSSLIQAIWTTLSAKEPEPKSPIREGEEKASIKIVLGTGEEYSVVKKFTGKNEYLEITSPDGFQTSKIANLEKLVGDINFDVFDFVQLSKSAPGRREQVATIKEFLTADEKQKLSALDSDISDCGERRTFINGKIKELNAKALTFKLEEEDFTKYAEAINIEALKDRRHSAEAINQSIVFQKNKIEQGQKAVEKELSDYEKFLKNIDAEIKELEDKLFKKKTHKENEIEVHNRAINELNEALNLAVSELGETLPVDLSTFDEELTKAKTHNLKADQVKQVLEAKEEIEKQKVNYANLGKKVQEIESEKAKVIAASHLPIEGMSFTEEQILVNGRPFSEEDMSTSELMLAGIKIAIAKNPNVPIIKIMRGESLDTQTMQTINKYCYNAGYQLFIEIVDTEEEKLKVVMYGGDEFILNEPEAIEQKGGQE